MARAGPRSCTWVPRAAVFHREGGVWCDIRDLGSASHSEIAVGYLSVEARTGHLGGAIIGVGNSLLLSNDRSGVKIGLRDECGAGAEAGVNISIHGQLSFVIS